MRSNFILTIVKIKLTSACTSLCVQIIRPYISACIMYANHLDPHDGDHRHHVYDQPNPEFFIRLFHRYTFFDFKKFIHFFVEKIFAKIH